MKKFSPAVRESIKGTRRIQPELIIDRAISPTRERASTRKTRENLRLFVISNNDKVYLKKTKIPRCLRSSGSELRLIANSERESARFLFFSFFFSFFPFSDPK